MTTIPTAMTIAGSDSGGGAGIQADPKTFAALGVYGTSALTAITAQNTLGVTAIHEIPTETIAAQIQAILSDIGADAVKTGMLSSSAIIETVAQEMQRETNTIGSKLQDKVVSHAVIALKTKIEKLREQAQNIE